MNVVVLTPDRVGSTLLQRLITVYMQLANFDRPVINLHELTNGLMPYYSDVFNTEVLGKPENWGYHQTLPEIVDMLQNAPHYKTSRLAHYHIRRRQDTIADQLPFYQYINDNFFTIVARRSNLLEHALSWCIYVRSKKLNVYSAQEKFDAFADIYFNGIIIERDNLVKYLADYRDYLQWVDCHFRVDSYFDYELQMPRLEKYILGLGIFENQTPRSWNTAFGIEFADWNRCHYLSSDMSAVPLLSNQTYSIARVNQSLSTVDKNFLQQHGRQYIRSRQHIQELVDKKVLTTGIPIKLQTMREKRELVRNWNDVVTWYNEWVNANGLGDVYNDAVMLEHAANEIQNYHANDPLHDQQTDGALHESRRLTNVRPLP